MQEFNIDIGFKELYTLKNFGYDIINNGSADLQVDSISISSDNVQLPFIKTPFIIMKDTLYSMSGYIKILHIGQSNRIDYIDYNVSQLDGDGTSVSDIYRYFLNYESIFYNTYTQVLDVNNVTYIKNMLILYFDSDNIIGEEPSIILMSIDDISYYIFPKMYRISDTKLMYVYSDNTIKNMIVDKNVKFFINSINSDIEIKRLSYRSI